MGDRADRRVDACRCSALGWSWRPQRQSRSAPRTWRRWWPTCTTPLPDTVVVVVWEKPVTPGARANRRAQEAHRGASRPPAARSTTAACPARQGPRHAGSTTRWTPPVGAALARGARCSSSTTSGDDLSRLGGILTVLEATFGDGDRSSPTTSSPTSVRPASGAAVGPHRRHRQGRRGRGARGAAPHARRRRAAIPLQVMVTLHDPLRADAPPRRRRDPRREGRRRRCSA